MLFREVLKFQKYSLDKGVFFLWLASMSKTSVFASNVYSLILLIYYPCEYSWNELWTGDVMAARHCFVI